MRTRAQLLLAAPVALSLLAGCKPSGPVTTRELISLTNAVQVVTTNPIIQIDPVVLGNRMMALTGSTTNLDSQYQYLFDRTWSGWRLVGTRKVKQ